MEAGLCVIERLTALVIARCAQVVPPRQLLASRTPHVDLADGIAGLASPPDHDRRRTGVWPASELAHHVGALMAVLRRVGRASAPWAHARVAVLHDHAFDLREGDEAH